jgi:hypothetical protein
MKKNDLAKIRVNYNVYGVNTFKSAKNKHLKSNDILLTSTNYYNSLRVAKSCDNTYYIKIDGEYIKLKDYRIQLRKNNIKYYISSDYKYITRLDNMTTYNVISTNKMIIEGHARDNKLADKLNNR